MVYVLILACVLALLVGNTLIFTIRCGASDKGAESLDRPLRCQGKGAHVEEGGRFGARLCLATEFSFHVIAFGILSAVLLAWALPNLSSIRLDASFSRSVLGDDAQKLVLVAGLCMLAALFLIVRVFLSARKLAVLALPSPGTKGWGLAFSWAGNALTLLLVAAVLAYFFWGDALIMVCIAAALEMAGALLGGMLSSR